MEFALASSTFLVSFGKLWNAGSFLSGMEFLLNVLPVLLGFYFCDYYVLTVYGIPLDANMYHPWGILLWGTLNLSLCPSLSGTPFLYTDLWEQQGLDRPILGKIRKALTWVTWQWFLCYTKFMESKVLPGSLLRDHYHYNCHLLSIYYVPSTSKL